MIYLLPGAFAGVCFYLILVLANAVIARIWSEKYQVNAHFRLAFFCLVAAAFSGFLALQGEGNWATHLQISGFLLAGVLLNLK